MAPEYATILAFDVKVSREAREVAAESGVNIFTADIIYHLTDQWEKYIEDVMETRKRNTVRAHDLAVPCAVRCFASMPSLTPASPPVTATCDSQPRPVRPCSP